ncbi:MAG: AarF/UbiB family protein [bacterium]|nr:AarF/UbiB family protein [bacterium]
MHGELRQLDGPYRTLLILEELGGVYLKFGQILAMRIDLIPARYAAVLMNLFSNVAPQPNHLFFKAFERATGKKPDEVFETIDRDPIGIASFAQVYKGFIEGKPVAIKIQKPDAGLVIKEDLLVLRFIIEALKKFGFLGTVSTSQLVGQFTVWLRQELDYRIEAANLKDMSEQIKKHGLENRVRIPGLYSQFVTKTTLVEEFFDGASVDDVIRGRVRISPAKRLKAAKAFQRDLMRQSWVDGFFHADPHPGNLMIFDDGRIGYIDFGIMGRASTAPVHFLRFVEGAVNRDAAYSTKSLMQYAHTRIKNEGRELFEREPKYRNAADLVLNFITQKLSENLVPLMDEWHEQTGNPNLSLFERSSSVAFYKMIKEASKLGVKFPTDSIAFVRALLIIDMVCLNLSPKFNMIESAKGFFEEFPMERVERENPLFALERKSAHMTPTFSPHLLANSVGRQWDIEYQAHRKGMAAHRYENNKHRLIRQVGALAEKYPELYTTLREVL